MRVKRSEREDDQERFLCNDGDRNIIKKHYFEISFYKLLKVAAKPVTYQEWFSYQYAGMGTQILPKKMIYTFSYCFAKQAMFLLFNLRKVCF